ncbi:MAG: hypothetical protein FJ225_01045 [Lentisphaerae bacterium]|nr:hypothetical protein [Lentisphaerota bacterium]
MDKRRTPRDGKLAALWLAALAATGILYACNLLLGDLNQDEGWYLYAARQVARGRMPYADFAVPQGPVMPFVYAAAYPLVDAMGVAGGRLFSAALGFAAALCAAWLAARLSGGADGGGSRRFAALAAFCLCGVNVYQSYFTAIVKTYALTALLLAGGFVLLTLRRARHGAAACFGSGVLLALAAGARTSAALCAPVALALLAFGRRDPSPAPRFPALWFGLGGAAAAAAAFGPFALSAPRGLWFGLFGYHASRAPGGPLYLLACKAGFLSRVAQAYLVAGGLGLAALMFRPGRGAARGAAPGADRTATAAVWLGALAMTVAHFAAPFPYDDYQTIVFPLFAAGVAVALFRLFASVREPARAGARPLALAVLLLCLVSAFSSPINQAWFVRGRDLVWWPLKAETPLRNLRKAAAKVRELTAPGDLLLTQDPYLAVESGLDLPPGMEMGPFSYFPGWSRERAARLHVLNRAMMFELLRETPARAAAFSEWAFAVECPSVTPLPDGERRALWDEVERRFREVERMGGFGQGGTGLRIMLPRS